MAIRSITFSNFKSFSNLSVTLRDFNVVIGSNAAGKSNFIQAFRFLRDIAKHGLENAIAMQGGVENLLSARIGYTEPLAFSIVYTPDRTKVHEVTVSGGKKIVLRACESRYDFALRFRDDGTFAIVRDELVIGCDFDGKDAPGSECHASCHGEIRIANQGGVATHAISLPEGIALSEAEIVPLFFREARIPENRILLETRYAFPLPQIDRFFDRIGIYDLDPKLPKKGIAIAGRSELDEDGSNLALAVKKILDSPLKKRALSNLIRDIFPFIDELGVKKTLEFSWMLTLRERYAKEYDIPAFALSDGTLSILMLIVILYFEEKPFLIIEEPVAHIHPFLATRVVSMMQEASAQKQILVTTHSVEVVKHACLEDIMLVSRGKDGFSTISRPADKEEVRTFLENELGIEDLYLQNMLEF